MAIKAMKAGINVLTEKPIATCLQDADRMIRTAEETHVKLGVIFQTRYTKSVEKLREMIQRGDFGKILTARSYLTWNRPLDYYSGSDWKGTWDKEGGGVLIDQAIHSIDRVRYMLDSDVEWIDGSVHNYVHHFVKVEDAADAAIMFKNGCLYNLYACNIYGADSPINIELIGEKGRLGLKQDMGYYELDGTYAEIRNTYETTNVGPDYWGSSHHLQIRDFYRSVREDLPVAIVGGVSLIMAVYFIINLAYLWVLPASELATLTAPASAVAVKILGKLGGQIVSIGIIVSVFGSCNGFILSGSRVAYSLAAEGKFPFHKIFAKLNGAQVPANAIMLVGGIGAFYALSGQFNLLTDLAVFSSWTFYTLTFIGVIKLRKDRPNAVRTYKVPLYPIVPLIAIASGIFVIINQIFLAGHRSTVISIASIIVMLLGLPAYMIIKKRL